MFMIVAQQPTLVMLMSVVGTESVVSLKMTATILAVFHRWQESLLKTGNLLLCLSYE